jgi:hypothetical protein
MERITTAIMVGNDHLDLILRHINHVREGCLLLGERLIENGQESFGRSLIANGFVHDNSKFYGIEWLYLREDIKDSEPDKFVLALQQHITTNQHHPEFWPEIECMPPLYIAEMVVDWKARSSEFGTDLRSWVKDKACRKYHISTQGKLYKQIKDFMDLLLERKFIDGISSKGLKNGTVRKQQTGVNGAAHLQTQE